MEDARRQADASDPGPGEAGTGAPSGAGIGPGVHAAAPPIVRALRRLNQKVQTALVDALLPGEQPHVVIEGAGGSAIVGTGERALVLKAGARSGAPLGVKIKAFEFESVIGVRLHTESPPAVVAIDAPVKMVSCRIYWADDRDNAWKARNAVPVGPALEEAAAGVEALKGLLEAYRDRHPPADSGAAGGDDTRPAKVMQALPAHEHSVVAPLPVIGERCPHCRAELRPGWRYCPACGAPSESATAPRSSS